MSSPLWPKQKKRGVAIYVRSGLNAKKVFQDQEGRMLAVEVIINNKKTLVVGLYAPNGAKEKFFQLLKKNMDSESYEQIIMMGDYNAVSNPKLDKAPIKKKGGKSRKFFLI